MIAVATVNFNIMMHPEPPESPRSDAGSWEVLPSGQTTPTSADEADQPSSDGSDASEGPEGRELRLYAAPSEHAEHVPGLGSDVVSEATGEALDFEAGGEIPRIWLI